MSEQSPRRSVIGDLLMRRSDLIFCVLATLVCLGFIAFTQNIWEDFFITFRHSRNLCRGQGLVYEPGQRVHGFTSPLGVLLPAWCHWLTGMRSHVHALWAFRLIFAIPAYVVGGLLLIRLARRLLPTQPLAPLMVGTLYLLDIKSVAFATNGMETGLVLLFFIWSLTLLCDDHVRRWPTLGLAWAGMMWTRPDACVYITALGLGTLAFTERATWKNAIIAMLKAAAVTTILYLPWFAWAWWYYGSPVPHTILAKGGGMLVDGSAWMTLATILRKLPYCVFWVFGPVYPHFHSWPIIVYLHMIFIGLFCFIYWLVPWNWRDRATCRLSLIFFLTTLYLAFMAFPYPWYYAPSTALGALVLPLGWCHLMEKMPSSRRRPAVMAGWALAALSAALLFGMVAWQLRLQQRIVENGVRTPLGRWLRQEVAPGERVYLECLGYIGYFSESRMLDFPGLATPEVVALRRHGHDFYSLPTALAPEWMVLRMHEYLAMARLNPDALRQYTMVKVFEANDALDQHLFVPGEAFLLYDIFFVALRRQDVVDKTETVAEAMPPESGE